jgi:hypothetical protein
MPTVTGVARWVLFTWKVGLFAPYPADVFGRKSK